MGRIATKGGGAVDNFSLALALYELADLLELRGEDAFKVRAYQRAAQALEQLPEEAAAIAARAGAAGLMKVPGIGKAIAEKLMELLTTGSLARLEELRAALPPGLKQLVAVPGLGARTASLLFGRLGIASLDDLELAARQGRLRDLPGFSRRREEQVLAKIPAVRQRLTRTPSAALLPLARAMATALAAQPGVQRAEVAGSLRRGCDTAADIDLVLAAVDPGPALQALGILRSAQETEPGHWQAESSRGHRIDVYITPTAGFGAAWLWATGSAPHLEQLQARAAAGGAALGPAGLQAAGGGLVAAGTEAEIYGALGLAWVPPELREGEGEVDQAAAGALPRLIEAADLRGDLHTHTRASDGVATLAEMAQAAADLGHAYLAITDHSPLVRVTNGLDPERLAAQRAEVRRLAQVGPTALLHGCEVDIRQDGSLDLPDAALAELDVVVASVHMRYNQDEVLMTERICRALATGRVHILGHPTGRLVGSRDPFDVDLDRVFALAAERGVALEISADPARLDLSGELAHRAHRAGCCFAIGTDAHATAALAEAGWGVQQARRAALTAADVINCLELAELRAWLRR